MSNKQTKSIIRQIANLSSSQQADIVTATDEELPAILQQFGIELPASTWWLRILKIALYALGLVLAGIGTANAQCLISNF